MYVKLIHINNKLKLMTSSDLHLHLSVFDLILKTTTQKKGSGSGSSSSFFQLFSFIITEVLSAVVDTNIKRETSTLL